MGVSGIVEREAVHRQRIARSQGPLIRLSEVLRVPDLTPVARSVAPGHLYSLAPVDSGKDLARVSKDDLLLAAAKPVHGPLATHANLHAVGPNASLLRGICRRDR